MTIINYGDTFELYSDDLKTFENLPAGTYKVNFHMMSGFSLQRTDNFETIESKIYGNHREKIEKVLTSYGKFERSMGIILSGEKGMGKSLFTQLLAEEAIKAGLPVIIVNKAYKGIADFIDKFKDEVLVLFDEFEKIFTIDNGERGETQNDLLGLFDGTSQKKRLYAITVNKLHQVSEFMMNRTGRFHYHIRFDYPTPSEIEIYLKDKLEAQYYGEIKHVVSFSEKVKLNYDSLRAIAFELNEGYSFHSAIGDLNILATDAQRYDVRVAFSNGKTVSLRAERFNLFSDHESIHYYGSDDYFSVEFNPAKLQSDNGKMMISGDDVELTLGDDNETIKKGTQIVMITMTLHQDAGVHYRLTV